MPVPERDYLISRRMIMADVYSVNLGTGALGANARRAVEYYPYATATAANPFSRFGTPEIAFHKITSATGVGTNPGNADSVFSKVYRAVAEVAELYYINAVAANTVIIGIVANTNNGGGVGNTANDKTLKEAIDAAIGGGANVTVGAANTAVFQES
jgi:hypothetical protein